MVVVDDDGHAEVLEHLQACAEGLLEHVGGDDLVRRSLRDDPAVDRDQVRQVRRHAVEVVGGQHDRDAVVVQVGEQVQHVVARA